MRHIVKFCTLHMMTFFLIPNSCHHIFIANVTVAPTEQDSTPGEERCQSDGGQGFRSAEVDPLHPDQLWKKLWKKPELVAAPGMKEAQKAGTLVYPVQGVFFNN